MRLGSLHNIYFYQKLMGVMREHIRAGDFGEWRKAFLSNYQPTSEMNNSGREQ
jgi:queuine/archaeosine tRNA-ribosyltransferase